MNAIGHVDVPLFTGHSENQFLSFELAGEQYAVDILKVQEIRRWEAVREIPNTPAYVKGVWNLRGNIVPIIDLRSRFALKELEFTAVTVVVVVSVECNASKLLLGIATDSVSDVIHIDPTQIKTDIDLGSAVDTHFIKGMLAGERVVVLLDVDRLLDSDELMRLEQAV